MPPIDPTKAQNPNRMYSKDYTLDQILPLLEQNPQRIAALVADLSPEQLRSRPAEKEWSLVDVLAHLRSCCDVWGGCIRTIAAEDRPTIKAMNPTRWIKQTDYSDLEFRPSFEAYLAQRAELIAYLKSLPSESWLREATITGAGKPQVRSVLTYAEWIAVHERSHIRQIGKIVEAMQGEQLAK
jgi:hypothetical protein